MNGKTAEYINILGRFCGRRDVTSLDSSSLYQRYGIERADVMVLFGGSILAGGDVLAKAIRDRIASTYIIRRPHNRDSSADRAVGISLDPDGRSDRS